MKKEININKLAELSKLEFNEEEKKELTGDIEKLASLVEVLEGLPEDEGIKFFDAPLRSDEVKSPKDREILMNNAPEKRDGFFSVPEIGGEDE